MSLHRITYKITDANGKNFKGEFLTFRKTERAISLKIAKKHPEISLPFKSNDVKVNRV